MIRLRDFSAVFFEELLHRHRFQTKDYVPESIILETIALNIIENHFCELCRIVVPIFSVNNDCSRLTLDFVRDQPIVVNRQRHFLNTPLRVQRLGTARQAR